MPPKPRWIIVDANILRSAGGETADFPISMYCRDFLDAIVKSSCCVGVTRAILAEWKRHQSRFARQWRVRMNGHRKFKDIDSRNTREVLLLKIKRASPVDFENQGLLFKREQVAIEKDHAAIDKDWCLVIAALNSDRLITSLDEIVRGLLTVASNRVVELRSIVWVNPGIPAEESCVWLEAGAPSDEHRKLGSRLL